MRDEGQWRTVSRGFNSAQGQIFVSIRKSGIKLSAGFLDLVRLEERRFRYARVRVDDERQWLRFDLLTQERFAQLENHNNPGNGIYKISYDGKGGHDIDRKRRLSAIQCGQIIDDVDWLLSLTQNAPPLQRRFKPDRLADDTSWRIAVIPDFIHQCDAEECPVTAGLKGIYCYLDGEGKALYIGEGVIRSRFAQHRAKKDMHATTFKWTIIPDEGQRKRAEAFHLTAYKRLHGILPPFNLQPGRRT